MLTCLWFVFISLASFIFIFREGRELPDLLLVSHQEWRGFVLGEEVGSGSFVVLSQTCCLVYQFIWGVICLLVI